MTNEGQRILEAKAAYARGELEADELEHRVDEILSGDWLPLPEPCRCKEPESVEITAYGDAVRHYLCAICGQKIHRARRSLP